MIKKNIFDIPASSKEEIFEHLAGHSNLKIERIISTGQTTPQGVWYDQTADEWVLLIQGEAKILFHENTAIHLKSGDYILIPAHQLHRVTYTTSNPPCIWLAIHAKNIE